MNDLPVTPQSLRVDESLRTVCAGVRPLAGVPQPVSLEAGRVFVRLAAVGAMVRPENNRLGKYYSQTLLELSLTSYL
jgi:hypothetical protein